MSDPKKFRAVLRVEPLNAEAQEHELLITEGEGLLLRLREDVDQAGIDRIVESVTGFLNGERPALIFSKDIDVFRLRRAAEPAPEAKEAANG